MASKKKYTEEDMIEFASFAKSYQSSRKVVDAFQAYKNGSRLKLPNLPKKPEPRIIKEPGLSINLGKKKKQITLVFRATNGESIFDDNFTAKSTNYSTAVNELFDYLIDFFKTGFEISIKNIIVRYG